MSLSAPGAANADYQAGLAAHRAGRLDEAVAHLRAAIRAEPSNPDYLGALAAALLAGGATEPAARCYIYLLEQDPNQADAHFGLATIREAQSDTAGAIASNWRGLRLRADDADGRISLARNLRLAGFPLAAEREEVRAHQTGAATPTTEHRRLQEAEAERQLSRALTLAGELADAEAALLRAGLFDHDSARDMPVLGDLLERQGRLDEAAAALRSGLAANPENAAAHTALGGILARLGALDDAEASLASALECAPGHAPAHLNLANIAMERGLAEDALGHLQHALNAEPDYVEAHNNRANLLLLQGRYAEGWDEYEWRRRMPKGAPPNLNIPDWQGQDLDGKHLYVLGEQAAGDAVMFATCLGELAAAGGPVSLHCEARINSLMQRAFPWLKVSDRLPDDRDPEIRAGYAICLGSLPRLYRRSESDFARSQPYLEADPAQTAEWRARYNALGDGLKIGFSWCGGKSHIQRRQRAMQLSDWMPLFRQEGALFVDLQYGDQDAARRALDARFGLTFYRPAEISHDPDMSAFAAQVKALDLVISIDNTTVHFAGALGVPVWTLVPPAPSWRWQTGREDSPWYPSMTLFRRATEEEWGAVLGRAGDALTARLSGAQGDVENLTGRQKLPIATRQTGKFLPPAAPVGAGENLETAR